MLIRWHTFLPGLTLIHIRRIIFCFVTALNGIRVCLLLQKMQWQLSELIIQMPESPLHIWILKWSIRSTCNNSSNGGGPGIIEADAVGFPSRMNITALWICHSAVFHRQGAGNVIHHKDHFMAQTFIRVDSRLRCSFYALTLSLHNGW